MRKSALAFVLCIAAGATIAQTTVPNSFTAGTPANASQVNQNFQALANAIDQGITGYEIVKQNHVSSAQTSGPAPTFTASCSAGKRVLGGGFKGQNLGAPGANGGVGMVIVLSSQPGGPAGQAQDTQWQVQVFNNTTTNQDIVVTAICGKATP
ncbi:MAG: hypothetical protein WA210_13430 [Burkholderiaceae bacterium]